MKAFRKKIEDERGRRQSERKACLGVEFVIPSETQKPLMMRCDGNVSVTKSGRGQGQRQGGLMVKLID